MKTTTVVSAAATGPTAWIPVDPTTTGQLGLAIGCTITSGDTLTYKAQYTYDSLNNWQPCKITRSTTTATLTLPAHGVSGTSDSIIVRTSGDANLDGTYTVASVSSSSVITYTVANTGNLVDNGCAQVLVLRVFDHGTITAKSANFDGSIQFPVTAVRLNLTAWTSGKVTMVLNQGAR